VFPIEICQDMVFTEPKEMGRMIENDLNHSNFAVTIDETGNNISHLRPEDCSFTPEIATFHDLRICFASKTLKNRWFTCWCRILQ
jgi:hypothetical protein